MKKLPLFPHSFRKAGILLFIPSLVLGVAYLAWDYTIPGLNYNPGGVEGFSLRNNNLTDEVACIGLIISLLFIGFSKEKIEDEAIQFFRLEALQWAVYTNYLVLVLAVLFVYGGTFFTVMTFNLFTVLVIFIVRFRFVLYQSIKSNA